MSKRYVLMGASRGLGWATYQQLNQQQPQSSFLLVSRKIAARSPEVSSRTLCISQDFSVAPVNSEFLKQLQQFEPTSLVYFAGGGPYGEYRSKKWSDHMWCLNTTFLYPAELLHHLLSEKTKWPFLRNVILVGSAVAEEAPDPGAASYAAAKHALKGLVATLQLESASPQIQLFSPGYMQTDMLPLHSKPRLMQLAANPVEVAKKLIAIIEKND